MEQIPPIVELRGATKEFPIPGSKSPLVAVSNVSLSIEDKEEGEFIALLGPSGCGKSTVLGMISGIAPPDHGEVLIRGQQIRGDNPYSITVQQAYTCYPWLTVLGNVEFGLSIQGKGREQRRATAREYIGKVALADRESAYPRQLSGGMQQRVAIARALAVQSPIMLMDEPFGALDAQTRAEMQQMLLRVWQTEKCTIIFVTHDITEALLLADRIIVFSPRPAQIIHDMAVPFARPRLPEIVYQDDFINTGHMLVQLLKKSPNSGQVRVSV